MEDENKANIQAEDVKDTKEETKVESIQVESNANSDNVTELPDPNDKKGLAIAAMVLGICSIALLAYSIIPITCGILAIIFGVKSSHSSKPKMSKAGFIMGIVGLSLQFFSLIILVIFSGSFFGGILASI